MVATVCSKYKLPMIPYGSGTSLEGHTTAPFQGVCISMANMNKIVEVRVADMDVTVGSMFSCSDCVSGGVHVQAVIKTLACVLCGMLRWRSVVLIAYFSVAQVQPGIKWEELNASLKQHGLFFPMDPGPGASIGGMVLGLL